MLLPRCNVWETLHKETEFVQSQAITDEGENATHGTKCDRGHTMPRAKCCNRDTLGTATEATREGREVSYVISSANLEQFVVQVCVNLHGLLHHVCSVVRCIRWATGRRCWEGVG